MATTTARLGLRKPAASDNVAVGTDLDNNFDAIDAVVGLTDCTSTTRPSTPFKNQLIRETDTGSYYVSNGSIPASGSWVPVVSTEGPATVGAVGSAAPLRLQTTSTITGNRLLDSRRPAETAGFVLDFDGHMQFGPGGSTVTDTELYRVGVGALGIKGGAALAAFSGTATSQITNPSVGQLFYNTTDGILYRYDGAAWRGALPVGGTTAGTRAEAEYQQTGTGQTINHATDTRLRFDQINYDATNFVTRSALQADGGHFFTLLKDGVYEIGAGMRMPGGTGTAGERVLHIDVAATRCRDSSTDTAGTASLAVSLTRRCNANDTVAAWIFQFSGSARTIDAGFANTRFSVNWLHG